MPELWTRVVSVQVNDLSNTVLASIEQDLHDSKEMKPAAVMRREPVWKPYFLPRRVASDNQNLMI